MKTVLENKAKALAGALITALVSYAALAFQQGTALTLHGLEAAAVGAVVGFLGVHQAPANKKRAHAGDAGYSLIEVCFALVLLVIALVILFHYVH